MQSVRIVTLFQENPVLPQELHVHPGFVNWSCHSGNFLFFCLELGHIPLWTISLGGVLCFFRGILLLRTPIFLCFWFPFPFSQHRHAKHNFTTLVSLMGQSSDSEPGWPGSQVHLQRHCSLRCINLLDLVQQQNEAKDGP